MNIDNYNTKKHKKVEVILFCITESSDQGLQKFKLKEIHFLGVTNPGLLKLRET